MVLQVRCALNVSEGVVADVKECESMVLQVNVL